MAATAAKTAKTRAVILAPVQYGCCWLGPGVTYRVLESNPPVSDQPEPASYACSLISYGPTLSSLSWRRVSDHSCPQCLYLYWNSLLSKNIGPPSPTYATPCTMPPTIGPRFLSHNRQEDSSPLA